MARVAAAGRDNTGRRRYVDGMVFPTRDFPSDHALITAIFHPVRPSTPEPAAAADAAALEDSAAADADAIGLLPTGAAASLFPDAPEAREELGRRGLEVCSETGSSAEFMRSSSGGWGLRPRFEGGPSLYEYWGITDTSLARARRIRCDDDDDGDSAVATAAAVAGPGPEGQGKRAAEVAAAVERWYVRVAGRARGGEGDLDEQLQGLSRDQDSVIWIIFRWYLLEWCEWCACVRAWACESARARTCVSMYFYLFESVCADYGVGVSQNRNHEVCRLHRSSRAYSMGVYKWWMAGSVFMAAIFYSTYAALLLLPPPPLASVARPGVRLLFPTTTGTHLAAAGLLHDGCALPWSAAGSGNGSYGAEPAGGDYSSRDGLTLPIPPPGAEEANGWWFELQPASAAAARGAAGKVKTVLIR
jgi:hypothetical protein